VGGRVGAQGSTKLILKLNMGNKTSVMPNFAKWYPQPLEQRFLKGGVLSPERENIVEMYEGAFWLLLYWREKDILLLAHSGQGQTVPNVPNLTGQFHTQSLWLATSPHFPSPKVDQSLLL
jgi:hypothetical protein